MDQAEQVNGKRDQFISQLSTHHSLGGIMHKVSRSLLLAGVLAFGSLTAACGDKVELTQVGPPVGISSITVTPPAASIAAGSTIQLAVAVVADASTAKTVTWTSSSAAVATVDATGKVTGVASGTATIIATSTADATKAAASVITVAGGGPSLGNTVAISTVNKGNVPVQLNNVFGQIDVTLFVTGPAAELDLIQNCNAAGNFPASSDVIVASQITNGTQQNQSSVTLSFNTAATGSVVGGIAVVNAASSTPIFLNGNCVLKAKYGTATATNNTPITLTNVSSFNAVLVTTGPSAISTLNGLNYLSGDLTATITPVNFTSGGTLSFISGNFAGRVFTNVAPAAGTQTFTVTFPGGIVAGGTAVPALSIANYTSNAAGDNFQVTASVTTAGGTGFVGVFPTAGPIRIDNGAPASSVATLTSATDWLNALYTFTGAGKYVSAGDAGVDNDVTVVQFAASTAPSLSGNANYAIPAGSGIGPTQCSQTLPTWTTVTSTATIPKSAAGAPTQYRARVFETDKVGNVFCTDIVNNTLGAPAANGFFSVDPDAPSVQQTAGPATKTRIFTGNSASFAFADSISGFVLNRQMQFGLWRNFSKATADCVVIIDGVNANQTGTNATGCVGTANSAPNIILDGNTNVEAYYILSASSVDQAGNLSPQLLSIYLLDNTAPLVSGISIPQNLVGGAPVTFTSGATDNVDLKASNFNIQYTAATGLNLFYAGDNYGPNYDNTIVKTATINATVPFFIKQLQATAGGVPVALTAADSGEAQVVNVRAIDAANLVSIASTANIPNINISSSAGFTAGTEFNTFQVTNQNQAISNGATPAATPTSVTLTATAVLLTAGAQAAPLPFSQVCYFYQQTAAGFAADPTIPNGSYVQIGCVSAPSITDVAGVSRTWTYQLAGFDPPVALGTAGGVNVIAVGIKASGVGIATSPNANNTLAP
jgi:Bacterial Ig-like domain (group 2)